MEPQNTNTTSKQKLADSTATDSAATAETATAADTSNTSQTAESASATAAGDLSEYRTFAILGYILPFLFFLPLMDEKTKNVPYVRFHANQQLILLIMMFGVYVLHEVLLSHLYFTSFGLYTFDVLRIGLMVLVLIGAFNAYQDLQKELPIVGKFRLLR